MPWAGRDTVLRTEIEVCADKRA